MGSTYISRRVCQNCGLVELVGIHYDKCIHSIRNIGLLVID
jgi:hypothetical protein